MIWSTHNRANGELYQSRIYLKIKVRVPGKA